jgi:hypothetical protein
MRLCLEALTPNFFRTQWRVYEAFASGAGSNIVTPAQFLDNLNGFVGGNVNNYPPEREAIEMRFVGRSTTTGVKVSFSLYGIGSNVPIGQFRLNGGNSGFALGVRNAVNVLNASNGAFRCIDGTIPVWYDYVNLQFNSYWERRIRIGG